MIRRLFSEGFRTFFLTACLFSLLVMAVWLAWLVAQARGGVLDLPVSLPASHWHAHEMIFGYGGAVLAGFFLTAVPNWTGGKSAPQRFIVLAFGLWLAGRLAMAFSAALPPVLVAVVDLSFLPLLAAKIAAQLIQRPKPAQLILLSALVLFWLANLSVHLEILGALPNGIPNGLRAGLMTLAAFIIILGGRVTPGFTRNAMVAAGRLNGHPQNPPALAVLAIAPALALIPAILLGLPPGISALLALIAGAAALLRVSLWRGLWTKSRPILWALHLSYGLNAAGLLAYGLACLNIGSDIAALHLLAIGGVGGMTLAMLSRASLGHAGRPLLAPKPVALAYALLPLAAALRFAASTWPALYTVETLTAAALWLLAFTLATTALLPVWLLPRPPRAPAGDPPP